LKKHICFGLEAPIITPFQELAVNCDVGGYCTQ